MNDTTNAILTFALSVACVVASWVFQDSVALPLLAYVFLAGGVGLAIRDRRL